MIFYGELKKQHQKAQDLFNNSLERFFEILLRRLLGAMSNFNF
jgi:hypothetical protein